MDDKRRTLLRGALTLGMLAVFGSAALVSNVGAVSENKEASKKFVKKRINQAVGALEAETVSDQELVRYSAKMNVGEADRQVATIGPFTWTAKCDEDPPGDITTVLQISTSQDNSSVSAYDVTEDDFDVSDGSLNWMGPDSGDPVNGPDPGAYTNGYYYGGHAGGPDGTTVAGATMIFTNLAGFDCVLEGYFVRTS